MKSVCKCGVEFEGHHASKYCPECKALKLAGKVNPRCVVKDLGKNIGTDSPLPTIVEGAELCPDGSFRVAGDLPAGKSDPLATMSAPVMTPSPNMTAADVDAAIREDPSLAVETGVPREPVQRWVALWSLDWSQYGMCSGGYEVVPGWVWSQRKLVCVSGDAPLEVLQFIQDAIQKPVVNRVAVMGDSDYKIRRGL